MIKSGRCDVFPALAVKREASYIVVVIVLFVVESTCVGRDCVGRDCRVDTGQLCGCNLLAGAVPLAVHRVHFVPAPLQGQLSRFPPSREKNRRLTVPHNMQGAALQARKWTAV